MRPVRCVYILLLAWRNGSALNRKLFSVRDFWRVRYIFLCTYIIKKNNLCNIKWSDYWISLSRWLFMNMLTDGSFSCSCLSICWFSFELSGRCIQSLSSLLGVVLGFCIVWATSWIMTTMKEGPPKKGGQVRDSKKKNIYTHIVRIHHFVVPLCVVKGEKQSFGGKVRPHPVGVQSSSTRMISTS